MITVINPSTGATGASYEEADKAAVDAACAAAREAFPAWSDLLVTERAEYLWRYADILENQRAELIKVLGDEVGKPRWEADTEVSTMVGKVGLSMRAWDERCGERESGPAVTRYRPHGVVAVYGAYNFPGHLPNGHIVPALIAGNTVVFKPSELAPTVGQMMVDALDEAGVPKGVVNIVHGPRSTGEALAANPELDGLFFTGSSGTGHALHQQFADRPDKILALEMGGNNPLLVHDVANVDLAASLVCLSAYLTAGQRCTCARRLIVLEGATGDAFVEHLAGRVAALRVGPPDADPEPFHGPVISHRAALQLLAAQDDLVAKGAKSLVPLSLVADDTGLLRPGLLDVTAVADRPDEELFGPLLQIIRVPDIDAALREANNTRYGLAAGLISDDADLYEHFRKHIRAGIVNWNQQLTGASGAAPFGGVGMSGNHRPAGFHAADYCAYPVASIEYPYLAMPPGPFPGLAD